MSARRPLRVLAVVSRPLAHALAVEHGHETFEAVSPVPLLAVHIVRDQLRQALARDDIPVQVHFLPWARLTDMQVALALAPFSENAEEMFRIALSLYEAIGGQYSTARGLFYYAQFLASKGQRDKAIAALEQCRDKCLAVNLTDHAAAAQQAINQLSGQ